MSLEVFLLLIILISIIGFITFYVSTKRSKKQEIFIDKQEPRIDSNTQGRPGAIYEDSEESLYGEFDESPPENLLLDDPLLQPREVKRPLAQEAPKKPKPSVEEIMYIMLAAKPDKPYVGYELLQSLLSSGLRFGAMDLFHRYEDLNGKGKILFSLASASETGTFEINRMGAYSGKGLMMFLRLSANKDLTFAFDTMLDTARQLIDDLGGDILDDERKILTSDKIEKMRKKVVDFEQKQLTGDLFDQEIN